MQKNSSRARILFEQHHGRKPFTPFSGADVIENVADAYAIQTALVEFELAHLDIAIAIAGYKIGLTSPRMQALLNIDSPIAGVVFGNRIHHSNVEIARRDYVNLGIECEIAVRLGRDLAPQSEQFDFASVASAVDAVCPAFELVDDRSADYAITDIGSLIADNSWNAGVVLGEWQTQWSDLDKLEGIVSRNGEVLDRGRGADVLGHPFIALQWLANHLRTGTRGLKIGDIIATGSIVPTRVPTTDETCSFVAGELGSVTVVIKD
ncbi:MAG: 2-keto-4-pentenoate hydratase [Gammaproteobacteria bacterium]